MKDVFFFFFCTYQQSGNQLVLLRIGIWAQRAQSILERINKHLESNFRICNVQHNIQDHSVWWMCNLLYIVQFFPHYVGYFMTLIYLGLEKKNIEHFLEFQFYLRHWSEES